MTYIITDHCIGCSRCLSVCPTQAIDASGDRYQIDAQRCNGCQNAFRVPQCWAVCPTNEGCVSLTESIAAALTRPAADYWDSWFDTYTRMVNRLQTTRQTPYWHDWFDSYSHALTRLMIPLD